MYGRGDCPFCDKTDQLKSLTLRLFQFLQVKDISSDELDTIIFPSPPMKKIPSEELDPTIFPSPQMKKIPSDEFDPPIFHLHRWKIYQAKNSTKLH